MHILWLQLVRDRYHFHWAKERQAGQASQVTRLTRHRGSSASNCDFPIPSLPTGFRAALQSPSASHDRRAFDRYSFGDSSALTSHSPPSKPFVYDVKGSDHSIHFPFILLLQSIGSMLIYSVLKKRRWDARRQRANERRWQPCFRHGSGV